MKNASTSLFAQPKEYKASFEAWVVDNPERIDAFYIRPLFVKGTSRAHPLTGLSDKAILKEPLIMLGQLKKAGAMQEQLIVCGLMHQITGGSGTISELQNLRFRLPLLDMRNEVNLKKTLEGLSISGLPRGLPHEMNFNLRPGESVLFAWFDKNMQLTLARFTLESTA